METQQALDIVKALANGINPTTGEIFADDNPYQQPDIIRALFVAVSALEKARASAQRQRDLPDNPDNPGKPWPEEEENRLAELYDLGTSIPELVEIHGRTRGAIQSRLVRLGRLSIP